MLVLSSLHVAHAVTFNPRENWPSPSVATHHIAGYSGSAGLQLENHGFPLCVACSFMAVGRSRLGTPCHVTRNVEIKCKPCGCYYRPLIENCLFAVASASLLHEVFLELREKIAIKGCVDHLIQSVDLGSILGKRNKYSIFVRPSHPFQWRIG
jgi:hypothetical protein